jgi:hypothetical protein
MVTCMLTVMVMVMVTLSVMLTVRVTCMQPRCVRLAPCPDGMRTRPVLWSFVHVHQAAEASAEREREERGEEGEGEEGGGRSREGMKHASSLSLPLSLPLPLPPSLSLSLVLAASGLLLGWLRAAEAPVSACASSSSRLHLILLAPAVWSMILGACGVEHDPWRLRCGA